MTWNNLELHRDNKMLYNFRKDSIFLVIEGVALPVVGHRWIQRNQNNSNIETLLLNRISFIITSLGQGFNWQPINIGRFVKHQWKWSAWLLMVWLLTSNQYHYTRMWYGVYRLIIIFKFLEFEIMFPVSFRSLLLYNSYNPASLFTKMFYDFRKNMMRSK